MKLSLKRTKQCQHCPWRRDSSIEDIPNYVEDMHQDLEDTIANREEIFGKLRIMACHESREGDETPCIGWLANQLGPGNNIPLRMAARSCNNIGEVETIGEQHKSFWDTLPS